MPRLSLTNPLRLAAIIYGIYRTKKRTPERPFNRASAPKLTVIREQRLALEPGWTSAVCQRASQSGIEKRPQTGRQKRLREIEGIVPSTARHQTAGKAPPPRDQVTPGLFHLPHPQLRQEIAPTAYNARDEAVVGQPGSRGLVCCCGCSPQGRTVFRPGISSCARR